MREAKLSDGKGEAENTDKVVHVFKREGASMFAPQDVVSITAQGGLTICIAGHCITKRPEDWHGMVAIHATTSDKTEMRMDAYYYGFEPTGIAYIDKILSAVACAGKAYHHTNEWQDEASAYPYHDGKTPQEWIQNAANEAADICRKLAGI